MYAQVCTRPDIAFIVGMLGRYLNNPGMEHWKAVKRVMRYLQRTKDYILTYESQIIWRSLGILILTLLDAKIVENPHQATFIFWLVALSHGRVQNRL